MAVTRARNSGIKTGVLKYDSMLGGYPPVMAAPTATAGTESASVAFTAISGISTYRAISTPGSITATGSASPISVTGLTAGTGYTFQVRAENSVGNGAYSAASNSVTPTAATAFESIATYTGNGTASTYTFSSISGTYKHLQLRIIGLDSGSGSRARIRINSTTSGYTNQDLYTDGSTLSANAQTGQTSIIALDNSGIGLGGTDPLVCIADFVDYSDTSKTKMVRTFYGGMNSGSPASGHAGLRSSMLNTTSAITSIEVFTQTGTNFATGTSIALYGIKG